MEIKVSEMTEAESVNDEDLIMIVQNGVNKKVPASKVGTGKSGGDTLPIGAVIEWNSDIIPINWLLCNGQEVSRTEYAELFKILGTTYGEGDGSTTFNLPNRKGNVAVGKDEDDTDFNELGKTGGEKTHQHKYQVGSITSKNVVANAGVFATKNADSSIRGTSTTIATGQGINNNSELGSGSSWNYNDGYVVVSTGTTSLENNLQPYLVSNFIIKAKQSAGLVATIVDNLESTSETDALSANQGRVLNEKILDLQTSTEENNIKIAMLQSSVTGNSGNYKVDYSSIKGTVLASCVMGIANTNSNEGNTKIVPSCGGIGTNFTIVKDVYIENNNGGTTYISILVFYK